MRVKTLCSLHAMYAQLLDTRDFATNDQSECKIAKNLQVHWDIYETLYSSILGLVEDTP